MEINRSILCIVIVAALMTLFVDCSAFAQQAGERAVVKMPTPAQQTAINALNASIQEQQQRVAELQATLNETPFTLSPNDEAIQAAVKMLEVAEQELALSKASEFAKLQASGERLAPELIPTIDISAAAAAPSGGGGFFGRRNRPTPEQRSALDAFNTALEDNQQQVTQQRASLSEAIYTLPRNDAAIKAAVNAVIAAEQELAHARASGFLKLQASVGDDNPEFLEMVASSAAGGGGGFRRQAPIPADDLAGFKPIFDGKTLGGWDGDPMFWRAENGMIVAESTPEKVVQENTFLIWRAGTLKDFELKLEARFSSESGNSGIQVRSRELTVSRRTGEPRKWGVGGYQIDMLADGGTGSGLIYGEGGGGFLSRQGMITRRTEDGLKQIGILGDEIPSYFNPTGEWNSFHVVAKDNTISVYVNGRLTSVLIDEHVDPELGFALEGLLALQMHVGDPFRLEFKNIYLKEL